MRRVKRAHCRWRLGTPCSDWLVPRGNVLQVLHVGGHPSRFPSPIRGRGHDQSHDLLDAMSRLECIPNELQRSYICARVNGKSFTFLVSRPPARAPLLF